MRYFRASDIFGAKVYLKGWRAPGHSFLPNEFPKWSKSIYASRWLARKIFFFSLSGWLNGAGTDFTTMCYEALAPLKTFTSSLTDSLTIDFFNLSGLFSYCRPRDEYLRIIACLLKFSNSSLYTKFIPQYCIAHPTAHPTHYASYCE